MKKGTKQGARDLHDPVRMQDIINWWVVSEEEHGIAVELTMRLATVGGAWGIVVDAKGYSPAWKEAEEPLYTERGRWPNVSHQTVTGMLLGLLMRLDDQAAAQDLLAGLGTPSPR